MELCSEVITGRKSMENSRLITIPRLASKSLTVPVLKEHHEVEYRHSHVADILQIGWETNTSHAEHGQLSI